MIPGLHGNRLLEFHTALSIPPPPTSLTPLFLSSSTAKGKTGLWTCCSALLVSSGRRNDGVATA